MELIDNSKIDKVQHKIFLILHLILIISNFAYCEYDFKLTSGFHIKGGTEKPLQELQLPWSLGGSTAGHHEIVTNIARRSEFSPFLNV